MKKITLLLIKFYQLVLSGDTGLLRPLILTMSGNVTGAICKHNPTCSEYTYRAVEKYGTLQGLFLGIKRLGACT